METKKYCFIDCGAHKGLDILNFYKNFKYPKEDIRIVAFEANPNLIPELEKVKSTVKNIEIINKAVCAEDGIINFRIGHNIYGSTINPDKNNFRVREQKLVEGINFSKWLFENVDEDEFLIVSLDVEGAEYDIVDSLYETGMINLIDKLYIEFHGTKLKGFDMAREKEMVQGLIDHFGKNVYIYQYYQHEEFLKLNLN